MFKMLGVLVFLTILCSINGSVSEKKRIHGGNEIDAPFAVYLEIAINGTLFECTASLIKPQYILTAAHCVEGATRVTVIYGCNDLRNINKCKTVDVKDFWIHPKYFHVEKKIVENDIAVAMLSYPIRGITPIKLPNRPVNSGHMATLMGWGRTETGQTSPKILLSITLPIKEVAKEKIIVYHSEKKRIDGGDSGGPLSIGKTLFGVASHTSRELAPYNGIEGVYMNVYNYLGFIHESIRRLQ